MVANMTCYGFTFLWKMGPKKQKKSKAEIEEERLAKEEEERKAKIIEEKRLAEEKVNIMQNVFLPLNNCI